MKARESIKNNTVIAGSCRKILAVLSVSVIIAVILEILLFNISSLKTLKCREVVMAEGADTGDSCEYEVTDPAVDTDVCNISIEDLSVVNAEYAEVSVKLTDEGDEYEYDLPSVRVVPGIKGSGYINIYPYGKVGSLSIKLTVSEGATARIGRIGYNSHRPFDIKPLRVIAVSLILFLLIYVFKYAFNIPLKRNNRYQIICVAALFVMLCALGRWMSVSNPLMVSCPWPHHKQYAQLAHSLDAGTVKLDMEVDQRLLEKANPYDTSALLKEEIPYGMDYAYFKGSYYVYFGIVPELLLYYPYFKLTGRDLANYNADLILYMVLVAGVLLSVREIIFRFAQNAKARECAKVPFAVYILMCIGICLFPNVVYLISRPDVYNIPIMAASAFTFLGIGLWLRSDIYEGYKRALLIGAGSLCMALVAGCRPQMLLFGVPALFIFLLKGGTDGRISVKNRSIFVKNKIADTLAFILPYVIVAIIVCIYNQLRFGNILDFGATYSLTSNDMNHRGFNADRLARGLYCFLFQPPVMTTDFPFMQTSVIESAYMGRNLTEYTYGGVFAACPLLLSLAALLFGKLKGMAREAACIIVTFTVGALIISGFDVNGAGILYRYTCDMIPGLILASLIMWIVLMKDEKDTHLVQRLFTVALLFSLSFAFLVFMGTEGSVCLKENAVPLYETVRQYFAW